jgi:hypothetical protein
VSEADRLAEPDVLVRKVENLADRSKPWCVVWRKGMMEAPAFWYYRTKREAMKDAESLRTGRYDD